MEGEKKGTQKIYERQTNEYSKKIIFFFFVSCEFMKFSVVTVRLTVSLCCT